MPYHHHLRMLSFSAGYRFFRQGICRRNSVTFLLLNARRQQISSDALLTPRLQKID
jgi:hypothetical protein